MAEKGALFSSGEADQRVYTDSMFWCGPEIVQQLLEFVKDFRDIYKAEVCIYGDFLACMGTRPSDEKIYTTRVATTSPVKAEMSRKFQNAPLEIIVLEQSKFYHLGTMQEYLEHLRPDSDFFKSLAMEPVVNCHLSDSSKLEGTAVNCLWRANVQMEHGSIMDTTVIATPLIVGAESIVSNCWIDNCEIDRIPADWLFHTVPIFSNNCSLFVTIAFNVRDDLKARLEQSHSWKHLSHHFAANVSSWNAKLFVARPSMSESFYETWSQVTKTCWNEECAQRFSMADIISMKNIPALMEHREYIATKILTG